MIVEFLFLVIVVLAWIWLNTGYKYRKFPPGPYGIPILGYLPFLGANPHKTYAEIEKKYGPIFSVSLGQLPVVVLNDVNLVRKAFKSDMITGRPKSVLAISIISNGLTLNEGPAWLEQRKFMLKTLKNLGFGKSSLENVLADELETLLNYLKTQVGTPIYLKPILEVSVMNTLWKIVTGGKHGLDDPEALRLHKICYEGFIEPEMAGAVWFLPWLAKLAPKATGFDKLVLAVEEMRKFFGDLYDEHLKSFSAEKLNDFVDHYINRIHQTTDPDSSFYKDSGRKNICDVLINIFSAGSDTTSSTISWAILYMKRFPHVLQKIENEIETVIGYYRLPNNDDRRRMPYTEATIHEILRFSTIVPGGLLHSTIEDTLFEGYDLPKGTIVMANIHHIHHNPELWGADVNEFKPERFLCRNENEFQKNENLISFSAGKRICPAESLAMTNFFVFFIGLIQNFSIETTSPPSLEGKPGLVISPHPYDVILRPRGHQLTMNNNSTKCS